MNAVVKDRTAVANLKDAALFRESCYIDAQWVEADARKRINGGLARVKVEALIFQRDHQCVSRLRADRLDRRERLNRVFAHAKVRAS